MNEGATELNLTLEGTAPGRLLSGLGRRLYFPHGIIAQSNEAKKAAHFANATIGMAYSNGKPLILRAVAERVPSLSAQELVAYAPTSGVVELRELWKTRMLQKNPSIAPDRISLPTLVPGVTAGISYIADLFLDEETPLLASIPRWDNYDLIFADRRGARIVDIALFTDRPADGAVGGPGGAVGLGLNLDGIRRAIAETARTGAVRIILNFPNNPSGYAPTQPEAEAIIGALGQAALDGADVLVICDDAYSGLFYDTDAIQESLFGRLASLHERLLAVKIDGPTKEDYVWGFRTAFVTFGSKGLSARHFDALSTKLSGAIRSSVSCANTSAQYLLLKALADDRTTEDKRRFGHLLRGRYEAVRRFIAENPPPPPLKTLPFNSGYFMSFYCPGADALRERLLARHGVGVVALSGEYLRVTFAALDTEIIPTVFKRIYETVQG
jgi:aspartate/methionine/tyrosine aminotransferase